MRLLLAFACLVGLSAHAHATPCAESIGPGPIDPAKDVRAADHTMPGLGVQKIVTHPGALEIVGGYFSPSTVRVRIVYGRPRREVWTTPDQLVVCTPNVSESVVVAITAFREDGVRSSTLVGTAHPEGYTPPPYSAVPPPVSPLLAIMTAAGMLLSISVLVIYAVGRRERIRVPAARARFRGVERPTLTDGR